MAADLTGPVPEWHPGAKAKEAARTYVSCLSTSNTAPKSSRDMRQS